MAIELEKLLFSVETSALKDALDKIDAISASVGKLASATDKLNKVTDDEVKAKKKKTEVTKEATKAETELEQSTKKSTSILEKQQDILNFMSQGFSKGQSTVLAQAKAIGQLSSETENLLKQTLQYQRVLQGASPFDKSMSGMVALKNQIKELQEAMYEYNAGTGLTRDQTRDLARDIERIKIQYQQQGKSVAQVTQEIENYRNAYVSQAKVLNEMIVQERSLERAQKDRLNAIRAIQAAEERATATLDSLNSETAEGVKLNERAALAVGSYERNLRLAGVSAEEASQKLKTFKEQQAKITEATSRNQMNYLARGIGVQMGDVGVSLAGGMNPLLVAVQQGSQVQQLIQMAEVDAKDMEKVMGESVRQMVESFKLMGVAVGSFVTGAIKSLGEYATTWTGVNKALQLAQDNMLITEATSMRLNKAIGTVLAGSLGVIITLSAAFVIASKQMLDANNALDRSLAQFGATLGITSKEAHALAQSQTELGVTSATATNALADFAKSGITDVGMLEAALQSAIKTQKILGISTEDTAKVFADLRKKPTETLIEIAKNTGLVNAETIKYVHTLEEQGKTQEAVAIAQGAVLASMEGVRQVADVNLTEVEKLWRDVKNAIGEVWGAMQNLSQNTDFWKGVRDLFAKLKLIAVQTMNVIGGIGLAIRDLLSLDYNSDRINGFINEQNQKAADEYEATMRNIYSATKESVEAEKKSAEARKVNAVTASKLAEEFKKEKENEKKMESEAKRLRESFIRDQESLNKIRAEAEGKVELLTKAEMKLLEIQRNPDWAKRTKDEKQKLKDLAESAKQAELYANALKNTEDTFKAWGQVTKELQNQNIELDRAADSINNEYTLLGLTGVEREKASRQIEYQNDLLKAQANYQKNVLNAQANFWKRADDISKEVLSPEERAYQFELNAQMYEKTMLDAEGLLNKERETAGSKTNLKVADSYYKEMQRVSDMLADVLITALTEGGKAGSKKLGDYIKKELLSASSMFISSIIRAQLGNFMQSAFGINASNFQGGTLASNLAGTASSAYNTFTGGQGLTGSLYSGFAMSGVGQSLGLSGTVGLSGIEGFGAGVGGAIPEVAMTGLGSSIGAALPYIGLGLTAVSLLGDMFSSGGAPKSMLGGGGRISAGKASYDPTGQMHWTDYTSQDNNLATSIISDQLVQALKKINSSYSAGAYVKGEINTKGSSSNQMLASATNEAGNLIYHFFQETGKGIEDFNKFVQEQVPKIQLALVVDAMRSSGEDYKEIANLIVGDSEDLTNALKDVSQEGIAAMQSSLSSAMQAFEIAGNMFEEIGVKISGQDFNKVAEATGGFDNLNALLGSYYENFYSAEEKRIHGMKNLVESFNEQTGSSLTLEKALSLTKTEFRDLYEESVRLLGVANPTAVAMLKVAGSFAELNNEADEVIKTVGSLKLTTSVKTELDDSLSFIEDYVQSSKELIEEQYRVQLEAENKKLDSAKETFNSIKSQVDSLKNTLNSISYFKEFSTGSGSTLEDVRSALGSTGSSDYFKLMGITYDAIGNLKTDAEKQLDVAKEQVQAIERQIKVIEESKQEQVSKLDAMLQKAKDQYDAIFKVEKAVNSLADAINKLAGAASAAATTAATQKVASPVPGLPMPEKALSQENINKIFGDTITAFNGDLEAAADSLYTAAIQYGVSAEQLAIALDKNPEDIKQWAKNQGLPPLVDSINTVVTEIIKPTDSLSTTPEVVYDSTSSVAAVVNTVTEDVDKLLSVIRERESLMIQEWQLLGDINSIRKLELAKVDESNRAIQERIWKLQDEAEAASIIQGFVLENATYEGKLAAINKQYSEAVDKLTKLGQLTDVNSVALTKWLDSNKSSLYKEEIERLFSVVGESFNSLINKLKEDIQELEKTFTDTDAAFDILVNSVNAEKEKKQAELDTLKNTKSELTSLIESISDAIKSLRKEVEPTNKMIVQSARNLLSSALGGASVDNSSLLEAVSTVSESVTSGLYGTKVDQERAYLLLANDLESLNKINKDSLDGSDQQILLLEQQIKSIDDVIVQAKKQIDTLRGIDTSVLTVDQAVKKLNEAVAKEESARKQIDGLNQQITLATNQYEQAKLQYQTILGIRTDIGSLQIALVTAIGSLKTFTTPTTPPITTPTTPTGNVVSLQDQLVAMGQANGGVVKIGNTSRTVDQILNTSSSAVIRAMASGAGLSTTGVPAFADGGRYQGGLALVGEQGPELINFNKPGMVYNNNQTASILSGDSSLSDKVERLAEAVEMLRYEARATAVNTSKMAKQLDRSSDQGDTLRVTVVT